METEAPELESHWLVDHCYSSRDVESTRPSRPFTLSAKIKKRLRTYRFPPPRTPCLHCPLRQTRRTRPPQAPRALLSQRGLGTHREQSLRCFQGAGTPLPGELGLAKDSMNAPRHIRVVKKCNGWHDFLSECSCVRVIF